MREREGGREREREIFFSNFHELCLCRIHTFVDETIVVYIGSEVIDRVELYICSTSGPLWLALRWNL
jgi:hypothetical protein